MEDRTCETEGCERRALGEPLPALCTKHYMVAIAKAQKDAHTRFSAELVQRLVAKGHTEAEAKAIVKEAEV